MPESAISSQPSLNENQTVAQPRSFFLYFAILLVVVIFFGVIRWRLADVPLERDEGEYAYAGQLILDGVPPYTLEYNMKFPGTYYAYAGMEAIFGQTPRGIREGLLLVNVATIVLIFLLGRRLIGDAGGAA